MKKTLLIATLIGLLPTIALADKPEQCSLNSTCSYSVRGKFNKIIETQRLKAGKTYQCTVVRGDGHDFSIKNISASKGVTYSLKGSRFDNAFVIRGPKTGTGSIQYTLYNHVGPWSTRSIQFKCATVKK